MSVLRDIGFEKKDLRKENRRQLIIELIQAQIKETFDTILAENTPDSVPLAKMQVWTRFAHSLSALNLDDLPSGLCKKTSKRKSRGDHSEVADLMFDADESGEEKLCRASTAPPAKKTVRENLLEVDSLFSDGIISAEERETARKNIIDRIGL